MGNDTVQLKCFQEINFTDQLMSIFVERVKSSNHSTRGGGGGNNCIYIITSFMVNWRFSNIDLETEKTHPPYSQCRKKDQYDNDSL